MKNNIKVHHFIPWSTNKNLGKCYNEMMSFLSEDNHYGCFIDGDAVHTTTYFGKYIEETVYNNKEYNLFTCMTNRLISNKQLPENNNWNEDSQKFHREIGSYLWDKFGTNVTDVTHWSGFGGVLILISKKTWKEVGGFKEDKMIGIDTDIHNKIKNSGGKIGLMNGIYVQHWYRGGNIGDINHLI